jgi:hypothetical protein
VEAPPASAALRFAAFLDRCVIEAVGNQAACIPVPRKVRSIALLLSVALAGVALAAPKASPRTVSLDVKDAEARVILASMKKQCGIRNLVIDPDVQGSGTFYFREVPCETAFRVVLRTMNLAGQVESNSVMTVGVRR